METKLYAKLLQFIVKAHQNCYALGEKNNNFSRKDDGSKIFTFIEGEFRYQDSYVGGDPFGGNEIVFYKEKPLWIMCYYGRVLGNNDKDFVFLALQEALRNCTDSLPFRGPKLFNFKNSSNIENLYYMTNVDGGLENFAGSESINSGENRYYTGLYMGGLVDQR